MGISNVGYLIMFKDKTRSRKFWTHSSSASQGKPRACGSNGFIPKEILDFLFEYDSATGSLYRIRENDGRHIIPPKILKSTHFNIYDSINSRKRFRVSDLIRLIVNGNGV